MKLYLAGVMPGGAQRDIMNMYLAESGMVMKTYIPVDLYKDANILQSFYYASDFTTNVIIPSCKSFMLDSGAYSFMRGASISCLSDYVDKYCDFINLNNIDLFFELDLDRIIGVEETEKIRHQIIKKTNKCPICVWHRERTKDDFVNMCKKYEYVAISGREYHGNNIKYFETFPWFIETAHKYGAKIHGLGYTSLSGLTKYHFDSVDSTAWVTGNRYGYIYRFDGKTMQKINKPPGTRVKSGEVAIHNFVEWKKFLKYAEAKL